LFSKDYQFRYEPGLKFSCN